MLVVLSLQPCLANVYDQYQQGIDEHVTNDKKSHVFQHLHSEKH